MTSFKSVQIRKAFRKKGFTEDNKRDHIYLTLQDNDGKDTGIWTKMSHGSGKKEIGDNLLKTMAKQIGITSRQIRDYIRCTIEKDELLEIVIQK